MASNDTGPGLLSKMAKFVRNPTKDWSDLDKPEPSQDSVYTKQALKEMIERKRQYDFVRRREFDYLRKLRRNGLTISAEHAGRPSFFQNSTPSNLEERATTLKKIDEIEAHMSKQWWRGKQGEANAQAGSPLAADSQNLVKGTRATNNYPSTQQLDSRLASNLGPHTDYESTQMGISVPYSQDSERELQKIMDARNAHGHAIEAVASEFSASQLFSFDSGESVSDPELEEAAIRFANGDDAGAETVLLTALQAEAPNPGLADGWAAALFDLYRATGQRDRFDSVAIDYAQRFGRSSPAWFSTPELLGKMTDDPVAGQISAVEQANEKGWVSPALLDWPAFQSLLASCSNTQLPVFLDWSQLKTLTPEVANALAGLFAQWCTKPVRLHFGGANALEKTLKAQTPSGDKRVAAFWWQLRLDTLRILRQQDDFELAALEFCVTYEVSPPPWKDARCDFVHERIPSVSLQKNGFSRLVVSRPAPAADFAQASTIPMSIDVIPGCEVELSGEVLGDAIEAMDKLQVGLRGASRLVISCDRLIRVDFSAAGSILNWVTVREADGCQVQFRDVPRLVAAFFNVIGINEHALVVLRAH